MGLRQGHVAVHSGHGKDLRPHGRAAGGLPTARPGRRPAQMGKGHAGRRGVHQGHLLDRRAGLGPAGDGVLQLGRAAGHQDVAHHAAESKGAQLLEGARQASRAGAAGNLQLRHADRVRSRDWGKSEAVRV